MHDETVWAERLAAHRPRLRALARRMLGSDAEADDALQEAWLRVSRAPDQPIENVAGWLTTIVTRQCLSMLRSRTARREEPLPQPLPDPVVQEWAATDPAEHAVTADHVGAALVVVLDTLDPAERLAFVLHDMFALPYDEIAPLVERSPAAARQLASRARRRVQGRVDPAASTDRGRRHAVVQAWVAASRHGDFERLLTLLHPDAVLRVDEGRDGRSRIVRGAAGIAGSALAYRNPELVIRVVLLDGDPGLVATLDGRAQAVLAFTVVDDRVTALDIVSDPRRLAALGIR